MNSSSFLEPYLSSIFSSWRGRYPHFPGSTSSSLVHEVPHSHALANSCIMYHYRPLTAVTRHFGVSSQILNSMKRMSSSTASPAAKITSLDHLVLTVSSIPAATKWYVSNLGMKSEEFVSSATPHIKRYSLVFGQQKINLHELGKVGFLPLSCIAMLR